MNAGNVALFDKGLIDIVKRNVIGIEHRLREAAVPCDFHAGVELMRHLFNHKSLPKSLNEVSKAYPAILAYSFASNNKRAEQKSAARLTRGERLTKTQRGAML